MYIISETRIQICKKLILSTKEHLHDIFDKIKIVHELYFYIQKQQLF